MGTTGKFFTFLFNVLVVVIFIVIIYFHIYYTRNSNHDKLNIKCKTVYDCLGTNQMCFNNECKCGPNYRWNSTDRVCEQFMCDSDDDCRQSDNNLDRSQICKAEYYSAKKSCVCNYGYVLSRKLNFCKKILSDREEEIVKLRNRFLLKYPTKRSCLFTTDCYPNEFCFNNSCECQPNYIFDNKLKRCVYNACDSDKDCNGFDDKRVCLENSCENCQQFHYIDPITRFCNTTIDMFCRNSSDCTQFGDKNQICVDQKCICRPNFKLNTTSAQCIPFSCDTDADCQARDSFRICKGGFCKCTTNYRPDIYNEKCEFDSFNLWFLWILWWLLIMPFLLIAIVCFKKCSKQNINTSAVSLNTRTPILYYKNNYKTYSKL